MVSAPSGKARILILGPELGAVSGVSTHLNQLLESSLSEKFDLEHFTVGSEGREETPVGRFLRLLISPFALTLRIVRRRPEIVHINVSLDHKGFPRDAMYLVVARLLRRKVIFQVHGGELPRNLYSSAFVREQVVRRVLNRASVVVLLASSELAAYSEFMPGLRMQIIANGTRLDSHAALPEAPVEGPLHLAYVGRLVPTKGVSDCIEAAYLLDAAGRDFKLTIAGAGPEEADLKAAAEELVRKSKVEFVGPKFGDAKASLWRNSDIFVFPTSHQEGLPYALLESMAAGTVPITTRVGAQPDVVEDGVHGLFVPEGDPNSLFDAIVKLDDNRQLLLLMSQASMMRIRQSYTVERLSTEFSDLYQSLVSVPVH